MTGIVLGLAFLAGMIAGGWGVLIVAAFGVVTIIASRQRLLVVCMALVLAAVGWWRSTDVEITPAVQPGPTSLTGSVDSSPATTRSGQRYRLTSDATDEHEPMTACVSARNTFPVQMGEIVRVEGELISLKELAADVHDALVAQGCHAAFDAQRVVLIRQAGGLEARLNVLRQHISTFFQRTAPGDPGALMTGLLIGDDSFLTFESEEAFVSTGTTHITAVSGSNFAILVTLAAMIAGTAGRRRSWFWIGPVIAGIWCYALVVGLPPSSIRAAVMASLALVAARFGRAPDFLTLLVISAALQVAARPGDLTTLSFQLSVAATLALILVFSGWSDAGPRFLVAVILSTTAAHLATAPILAWHLGVIPTASIPANAAIFPLVVLAFYGAAISGAVSLVLESLAVVLAVPAGMLSAAMLSIVGWFAEIGGGQLFLGRTPSMVLIVLMALCWGTIAVMSRDCRVAAIHCYEMAVDRLKR